MKSRIVILNALPLNAFPTSMTFYVKRIDIFDLIQSIAFHAAHGVDRIESYIRHKSTLEIIKKWLNVINVNIVEKNELYKYQDNDVIFVVTLKKLVRGKEIENITIDDLEIFDVTALKGCWIP